MVCLGPLGRSQMSSRPVLTHVSLPLPWDAFGLPSPLSGRSTTLVDGAPGWRWNGTAPDLGIDVVDGAAGDPEAGWDVDHVVLLVPDMETLTSEMATIGCEPRLTMQVDGRPTTFFRVGTLLEVIESPVRTPAIYGVALVTDEPLEVVALRWRAMGRDVTDPKAAIQPGRRIMTVRATEAGFAVMSPDKAV